MAKKAPSSAAAHKIGDTWEVEGKNGRIITMEKVHPFGKNKNLSTKIRSNEEPKASKREKGSKSGPVRPTTRPRPELSREERMRRR